MTKGRGWTSEGHAESRASFRQQTKPQYSDPANSELSEFTGVVKVSFYNSYKKRIRWVAPKYKQGFPVCTRVKNTPANAGGTGDTGSVPGLGRSTGVGKV